MFQPENNQLQTPYGVIGGIEQISSYMSGEVRDVMLNEKNVIITHVGELVPYYKEETPRRKYKNSIVFHPNGMIKSIYFEEQQEITTPIGEFPAEFVTFYDSGELKRFFILEGKISGFWTEDNERALNIPFTFDFPFCTFTALLSGICLYKSGDIRSITLFPGEIITVTTKGIGEIPVQSGFSLSADGSLTSVEPAEPIAVTTPIGVLHAYDVNANGINADANSLKFDEEGRIASLITSSDKLFITRPDKGIRMFTPLRKKVTPLTAGEDVAETDILDIPIEVEFLYDENKVKITCETSEVFPIDTCVFQIFDGGLPESGCSPDKCKSCNVCNH